MQRVLLGFMFGVFMALGVGLPVTAGTVFVDFRTTTGTVKEGAAEPQGWSYSSIGKADNHAYFNAAADGMASPIYEYPITNVSVLCRCSSADASRLLTIIPLTVTPESVVTNELYMRSLSPGTEKDTQAASIDPAAGANAFLMVTTGGSEGNWTVYSAVIRHTGPESLVAPTGLRSENVTSNAFTASWEAVPAAEFYALRVWQEIEDSPTCTAEAFAEAFDRADNLDGGQKTITDKLETWIGTDWKGDKIYLPKNSKGIVQIGNTSTRGWLLTPAWTGPRKEDQTLVIRARQHPEMEDGTLMPIDLVHDGGEATNAVEVFRLTDKWAYYTAPLQEFSAGDRLLLHSVTNGSQKRAWIDSVQIVSGYVPGDVTTNEVFWREEITETAQAVTNLQEGVYAWAVRADASGEDGLWSAPATVSIAADGASGAGVWRTSDFVGGLKVADFGMVTNVIKVIDWTNGVSVAGFHAYTDGEVEEQLRRDSGKASAAGLYASAMKEEGRAPVHSLSLLAAGKKDVALELRILNDAPAERILCGADVAFTAYQWTFTTNSAGERVAQTLAVDWAVTTRAGVRPAETDWRTVEDAAFAADEKPASASYRAAARSFVTGEIDVPAGGMLWVRWRVGECTHAPMLGVGDVRVKIAFRREPTVLIIR